MDPYGQMLAKLLRLMPPPAPAQGWGLARFMVEAQELGPVEENRQTQAQYGLRLGATQVRTDAATSDWTTDPASWIFGGQAVPGGAQGNFLDSWGNLLGVPRIAGEADVAYGPRIIFQAAQASQTNRGLAATLEDYLGCTGVQVIDANSILSPWRLNNNAGRLDNACCVNNEGYGHGNLNCCFFIIVPGNFNKAACLAFVAANKAAGTRLLDILPFAYPPVPIVPGPPPTPTGSMGMGALSRLGYDAGVYDL